MNVIGRLLSIDQFARLNSSVGCQECTILWLVHGRHLDVSVSCLDGAGVKSLSVERLTNYTFGVHLVGNIVVIALTRFGLTVHHSAFLNKKHGS